MFRLSIKEASLRYIKSQVEFEKEKIKKAIKTIGEDGEGIAGVHIILKTEEEDEIQLNTIDKKEFIKILLPQLESELKECNTMLKNIKNGGI